MTKLKITILVFVLLIGLILRLHNYTLYPQRGASSDEYTYAFLGVSLLTNHVPISWSAYTAYKEVRHLTIDKLYFPIVYPYFDHPPLNGLLVGGWSILFGQDRFEEIDLKTIRLVPIFLSFISSILVFLLGLRLYTFKTAIWALLIYSTATIFVMNGRVVFAENLLTTLLLSTLYLFLLFRKKFTAKKVIVLSILCGLSFWAKELGIVTFLSILYLFLSEKVKPKYIVILIGISSLVILLYALYGVYYDKDLFLQVISLQANRDIGIKTLFYLLSTPIIVNKIYLDGWYFFGLISFFFSFWEYAKNKLLLVPSLAYFLLLIFSLTQEGEMGWYMIPMFPFMALFSAKLLVESLQKQSLFIFLLLLFVGLSEISLLYQENFGLTTMQFRILILLILGPFTILKLLHKDHAFRKLSNAWFYGLIFGTIFLTYNYIHPA